VEAWYTKCKDVLGGREGNQRLVGVAARTVVFCQHGRGQPATRVTMLLTSAGLVVRAAAAAAAGHADASASWLLPSLAVPILAKATSAPRRWAPARCSAAVAC